MNTMFLSKHAQLSAFFRSRLPTYSSINIGISGWTQVHHLLESSTRKTVILPAFICSHVSFMVRGIDKRLIHVDAAPGSLHMNVDILRNHLDNLDERDTVLLFDHTFGCPFLGLAEIRSQYPDVLIIEDCVRALEAVLAGGLNPVGDHVLFSMYKTVPQNSHGAILLSKDAASIPGGGAVRKDNWRNRLSGLSFARYAYDIVKSRRPDYQRPDHNDPRLVPWKPELGVPSIGSTNRFLRYLDAVPGRIGPWREAIAEIESICAAHDELTALGEVLPMQQKSLQFVSIVLAPGLSKFTLLARLHRQRIFLLGTWDQVPAFFTRLRGSFPKGYEESVFLADYVIHVPVSQFNTSRHRQRLARALKAALVDL